MRAFWKKGNVISLKLKENLYSLAQMVNPSAKMRFYNVFNDKDEWSSIDLNYKNTVFCVPVGNILIQKLGVRRIPLAEVIPSNEPCERLFINVASNAEGYRLRNECIWRGGNLVDEGYDARNAAYNSPIIIQNLDITVHREIILKFELENMYGDIIARDRLIRYYETGVNIEPLKFDIFPGFRLPAEIQ